MRMFTTSRTLAGKAPRAMLSTDSSLRQQRARRMPVRRSASRATTPQAPMQRPGHAPTMASLFAGACAAAANDSHYFAVAMDDKVRILRRDASDRACMVLSGRMADVCAALEKMC